MLAKISITCFAASYIVAWAMELARLFLRSGIRRAVMLAFTTAGLAAHTMFLMHRASLAAQSPLSSWYDWYLVAAWCLAAMYLYLTLWRPENPIGLFVLPCVLGLVGVAMLSGQKEPFPAAEAARHWGLAHGLSLLAGSVAVLAGFAFGVMYLLQAWRLKHKRLSRPGLRLPSLEWLQRMNERMIVASVFLLTLGFLAGIVSNRINHTLVPWSDPVVWSSSILVGWMLAATIFQALYKPARTGRKVAYLTVFSFMFLLITLAILKFTNTSHGSGKTKTELTFGHSSHGGGR
ncbi:MAG: cytochrome c biogenesis protein CcsA [Pirellulales bacterium]